VNPLLPVVGPDAAPAANSPREERDNRAAHSDEYHPERAHRYGATPTHQLRKNYRFLNFVTTLSGGLWPRASKKSSSRDERKIVLETGLDGKFIAESTGWDQRRSPRGRQARDRTGQGPLGARPPAGQAAAEGAAGRTLFSDRVTPLP
jgi:hypothetical protein